MVRYSFAILLLLIASPAMLLANTQGNNQAIYFNARAKTSETGLMQVINDDGNLSLGESQNRFCWNPHQTGFTEASEWDVSFTDEARIFLKTAPGEAGHVATGAWWTTDFKTNAKIPLYDSRPVQISVSFRAKIDHVTYQPPNEWLRIALACAVQRSDKSVIYTEMDFWDSPNTLQHPAGNTRFGGYVVYRGRDVVEYKIDQAAISVWNSYSLDLTACIDSAWSLRRGDLLESVYIVVETVGKVEVVVLVDDLWLTLLG